MGANINTIHEHIDPHTAECRPIIHKPDHERYQMQTAIEVLKTRLESLTNSVNHVNDKLDLIMQMQVQIVRLQEQFDTTRTTLLSAQADTKALCDRIKANEASVADIKTSAKTAFFVGAILFGVIQWYVIRQISEIDTNATLLSEMDRRLFVIEESRTENITNGLEIDRTNKHE